MTKICLNQNVDAWFEIKGGGQVHLRILSQTDLKNIKRQTVKKEVEFKRIEGKAERFEYEKTNEDKQNELFWDQIIIEWKGLYDSNENPIECTTANKVLLMTESGEFVSFITESLKSLSELNAQKIEDAEKN